ncbi:pyruvate, water dikinase regulatory protein [Desulfurispira natronophila]|uniref:Putative pyruvate, phosphate dikinase regulatory protein n=1 Tax=Desulfurispira natronophila TaxID=682562 RepID=A0A7W8DGL5_9BACT|nr:pyruvate, water dikinase regulatory protein [Desulfurispira natronophila]MBB5021494.1 hypothetical protein [Desulfurispira natronophila]
MARIYIISDGTGESAVNLMKAALAQFSDSGKILLSVFDKVDNEARLLLCLDEARQERAFVACTFVQRELRDIVVRYCTNHGIPHLDIIGPALDSLSHYMGLKPEENPNIFRRVDDKYFQRIEAMEYTLVHDDGKNLEGLEEADIVILGLSRTSKTPTSFVLAQQGYKVLNIPLIPHISLPEKLYDIDQNRIVCLVMDPEVLKKIRTKRLRHYQAKSSYTNLADIFNEVELVYEMCRRNRQWHVINTTNKSVEETAREVINEIFGRETEL